MESNLPRNVSVTDDGAVRYHWKNWWTSLLCAPVVFQFLPLIYDLFPPTDLTVGIVCFAPIVILELGLIYLAVGNLINYTEIRVMGDELIVQHKPLPWSGNKSVPMADFDKFLMPIRNRREKSALICNVLIRTRSQGTFTIISGVSSECAEAIVRESKRMMGKGLQVDWARAESVFEHKSARIVSRRLKSLPRGILVFLLMGGLLIFKGIIDRQGHQPPGNYNLYICAGFIVISLCLFAVLIQLRKQRSKQMDDDSP